MTYVVLAIGIVITVLFLLIRDKRSSAVAFCVKSFASLLFVATALSATFNNQDGILLPQLLIIFGLVCGLIGDITLDLKIYLNARNFEGSVKDSETVTYVGMGCFALGHIAYCTAVVLLTGLTSMLLYSALIALVITTLTFVTTICVLKMNFGKFFVPSCIYCFLLTLFGGLTVLTLSSYNGGIQGTLLLVGAMLFLVSDLILSYTYFSNETQRATSGLLNPESRFLIVLNHATYYGAQYLIALSLLFI